MASAKPSSAPNLIRPLNWIFAPDIHHARSATTVSPGGLRAASARRGEQHSGAFGGELPGTGKNHEPTRRTVVESICPTKPGRPFFGRWLTWRLPKVADLVTWAELGVGRGLDNIGQGHDTSGFTVDGTIPKRYSFKWTPVYIKDLLGGCAISHSPPKLSKWRHGSTFRADPSQEQFEGVRTPRKEVRCPPGHIRPWGRTPPRPSM